MLSIRQPIVLDVPWLVCVYVSACLSVSWTRPWAVLKRLNRSRCHLGVDTLGPRNHELGGGPYPARGRGCFGGHVFLPL